MLQRVRGTQDFLDLTLFSFLMQTIKQHAELYGFHEISTPLIEQLELFQRSLGLHTDVISKEMFLVGAAESDESLCLRPEATAPTMRAFFNNGVTERPWRVLNSGPMFRYERPQKGRFRQFHQVSFEIIGAPSIAHDAEFIECLDSLFSKKLHLDQYTLALNFLGSPEDREQYKKALLAFLESKPSLPSAIAERKDKNLLRIFDLKDEASQEILQDAPLITDHLSPASRAEWDELQALLSQLSVSFILNPRLVRGLDYYNKTVFEFVSLELGAQSSFCGGGRYDFLSQTLGEKEAVPALGAAPGIERLLMLLESRRHLLPLPQPAPLIVVIPLAEEQKQLALICAQFLRHHSFCVETMVDQASAKSMMRQANKKGARFVIIIGETEQQQGYVTLKQMTTGVEEKVKQEELVNALRKGA